MYVIAPSGPLLKTLPQYRPMFKGVAQMVTFYKIEMIRSLFCKGTLAIYFYPACPGVQVQNLHRLDVRVEPLPRRCPVASSHHHHDF